MEIPFLRDHARHSTPVRDPVWKDIPLTPELQDIVRSEPFLRLYRIRQLGPTELVYPGATHTRAAHSLGVYNLALRMLHKMSDQETDFAVTETSCRSFLIAALLHDLGHFPYTHSLKELPLEDHEALTARAILQEPLYTLIKRFGASPETAAAIVDHSIHPDDTDTEVHFFRKLLSGVLDPDKLDYLNRDALYCGVPYGMQDTDFVLSKVQFDKRYGIAIDSSAIMSIENILFSKYLMYRSVYWHRQVRIATAMMKKALWHGLLSKSIAGEDLYRLDDSGLFSYMHSLGGIPFSIAEKVRNRRFYKILGEFKFESSEQGMCALEDLHARTEAETAAAEYLSRLTGTPIASEDVLIDIPERISFESDLHILDENCSFSASTTVFNPAIVGNFTRSLRMARLAINPDAYDAMGGRFPEPENLARCIGVGYTK